MHDRIYTGSKEFRTIILQFSASVECIYDEAFETHKLSVKNSFSLCKWKNLVILDNFYSCKIILLTGRFDPMYLANYINSFECITVEKRVRIDKNITYHLNNSQQSYYEIEYENWSIRLIQNIQIAYNFIIFKAAL